MSKNKETLEKLLEKGTHNECISFLSSLSEKERRELESTTHLYYRKYCVSWDFLSKDDEKQRINSSLSVLMTGSITELKKNHWESYAGAEKIIDVVRGCPRECYKDLPGLLLEKSLYHWRLVRQLVKEGLCPKPGGELYPLGMIAGFSQLYRKFKSLKEGLLDEDNIDLLSTELWELLKIEGVQDCSLAGNDKYSHPDWCWQDTLIQLANEGYIPRDRFIATLFEALSRDFIQFRGGWHLRTLRELKLNHEERIRHLEDIFSLVGSTIPPTVSFAIKELTSINEKQEIEPEKLLNGLEPAFHANQKETLSSAIKLLESTIKKHPQFLLKVLNLASQAFWHESPDIHEEVLLLYEKYAGTDDLEVCSIIEGYADAIAPSLKNRAEKWFKKPIAERDGLKTDAPGTVDAEKVEREAVFHYPAKVVPLQDVYALSEKAGYILQYPEDIKAIEQVLDGVNRMGHTALTKHHALFSPLIKQTRRLLDRWGWQPPTNMELEVAYFLANWVGVDYSGFKLKYNVSPFGSFFHKRLESIVNRAKVGIELPLLSLPSLENGEIHPNDLLERLKIYQAQEKEPDKYDLILCLLRLSQDNRGVLAKHLENMHGEYIDALRYACGTLSAPFKKDSIWIAAARSHNPRGIDELLYETHPGLGPDAGHPARFSWQVACRESEYEGTIHKFYRIEVLRKPEPGLLYVPDTHLPVLFHEASKRTFSKDELDWHPNWLATVWPSNMEAFFSSGIPHISENLDYEYWNVRVYLQPLLFSTCWFGEMAQLLLALCLASSNGQTRVLATDVFIALTDDQRMDTKKLGEVMAQLLPSGIIKAARWSKALNEVLQISGKHAGTVSEVIQYSLRGDPENAPKDLGAYLETLQQALAINGSHLEDPEAISYLKMNKQGGKVKKIIKDLMEKCKDG